MMDFDTGKNGPRAAIRAKCLECSGGSLREVWNCGTSGCPLWSWRPLRPSGRKPRKGEQLTFLVQADKGARGA